MTQEIAQNSDFETNDTISVYQAYDVATTFLHSVCDTGQCRPHPFMDRLPYKARSRACRFSDEMPI